MKTVGILNVQYVNNYGAVLQAYALQKIIEELGYCAETIDYRPFFNDKQQNIYQRIAKILNNEGINGILIKVYNKFFDKSKRYNVNFSNEEKEKNFTEFRREYLKRSKVYNNDSLKDCMGYDIYVVGSDVVWKPDRIRSEESKAYFLEFTKGKTCQRIAYAASIGTDDEEILNSLAERFARLIKKFDYISLREKTSVPYVERLFKKKVTCCIDPTLLLQRKDYDIVISNKGIKKPEQDYIYLYLFEDNDFAFELVNRCSEILKLPVICQCPAPYKIHNLLEYAKNDGPIEFLERIRDAKYVITDSFHGTIFSVIFKNNFYTFSRGMISIRMQDFLSRIKLTHRYIENLDSNMAMFDSVDYTNVDAILEKWKKESLDYLKIALSETLIRGGYNLILMGILNLQVLFHRVYGRKAA